MRSCDNCGKEYADTDTIATCEAQVKQGRCGGTVLPAPRDIERTQACLICLDVGLVLLGDGTVRNCPRGCPPQETKP